MAEEEKPNRLKFRAIGPVIRAAGLLPWTMVFIVVLLVCAVLVMSFEPGVDGFGNSLWFLFQVVTTIGLGDYTATSTVGRLVVVVLSVYSVFFLALITGAVVSYCSERMKVRRDESVAHFMDQLEHLPELSHEELVELSAQVKRFDRMR